MENTVQEIEQGLAEAVEAEIQANPQASEASVQATVITKVDGIIDAKLPTALTFLKPILVIVFNILAPTLITTFYNKAIAVLGAAAGGGAAPSTA